MFRCYACHKTSRPGEKCFTVPRRAALSARDGLQITQEAKLCPSCYQGYETALRKVAPDLNPRSSKATLVR